MKNLGPLLCASALVLAAGCTRAKSAGGTVQASWTSSDTTMKAGHWSAPGRATWCQPQGRLLLLATARDTGLGIALRTDKLVTGTFAVADTAGPARIALRLPAPQEVEGYASTGGSLEVTGAGQRLSGRFTVELERSIGGRMLSVEGRFSRVPVTADTACSAPRQTDSTGIP